MAAGSIQTVVVCVTASTATTAQQVVCPRLGEQYFIPANVPGYVVDPSQASLFDLAIEPLDAASVGSVWSVAFSFVLVCFLIGRGIGSVLNLIRKG